MESSLPATSFSPPFFSATNPHPPRPFSPPPIRCEQEAKKSQTPHPYLNTPKNRTIPLRTHLPSLRSVYPLKGLLVLSLTSVFTGFFSPSLTALFKIELMDWYQREECDDFIVPNDGEALEAEFTGGLSPSPDDWYQWGVIESENIAANKCRGRSTKPTMEASNFDRQSLYDQVIMEPPVCDGEGYSNSSACGEPSFFDFSARTSEASFHCCPDLQLQRNVEQMDDIFLNSFLEEDLSSSENLLESLQMFPETVYRSLPFEDLPSNMLVDSQSPMKDPQRGDNSTCMNSCSFPLLMNDISEDWDMAEDSSPSCLTPDECRRSEGSPLDPNLTVLVPAELSASNESEAVAGVDEPEYLNSIVLRDLEDVMVQMNEKTRICFRDALLRLAKSSGQQHSVNQNKSANFIDRPSTAEVNGESSRMRESRCGESKTNVIDRTVANLMFNKPYCGFDDPSPLSHQNNREVLSAYGSCRTPDQL